MSACGQSPFQWTIRTALSVFVAAISVSSGSEKNYPPDSIQGQVGEPGVAGVAIFICDAKSGLPLDPEKHRPFLDDLKGFNGFLFARTDTAGHFCFTNIAPGEYRLVAQTLPTNSGFPKGDAILPPADEVHLYGTAENIVVPSRRAHSIAIHPIGSGTFTFDQQFPDGSSVLVSTRPLAGDPVLGFLGWSDDFVSHIVGVGTVPFRRTIKLAGLPERNLHVVIYVNDEIMPFGAADYDVLPKTPQNIPIVSGSSESQHEPPPKIRHILDVLEAHQTTGFHLINPKAVLRMRNPDPRVYIPDIKAQLGPLDRVILLPNGEKAAVADVFAADCYKRLLEKFGKR